MAKISRRPSFASLPSVLRLRFATLSANGNGAGVFRAANGKRARPCRLGSIMAVVLLAVVVEARFARTRRRLRRAEDQALRLGLQFADQLLQQARGAGQAGAER